MKKFNSKKIAYYALLIALNVVLTRVASFRIPIGGVETVRIGLGGFPIVFAGITFGPLAGGIVGAIGDVIGFFISPMGAYMPHFSLTAALAGIIPGLILIKCKDKKCKTSFWKLFLAIGAGQVLAGIMLWSYFMTNLFGMSLAVILPGRIISQLINIPIYAYMTKVLVSRVPTAFDLN